MMRVLIESDWNLKVVSAFPAPHGALVLIESDWNLKVISNIKNLLNLQSINRIRLEFKAQ